MGGIKGLIADSTDDWKGRISEEILKFVDYVADSRVVNKFTSPLELLVTKKESFPTLYKLMEKVSSGQNVATFTYNDVNVAILETILNSLCHFPAAIGAIACDSAVLAANRAIDTLASEAGRAIKTLDSAASRAIGTLASEAGQYVMGWALR